MTQLYLPYIVIKLINLAYVKRTIHILVKKLVKNMKMTFLTKLTITKVKDNYVKNKIEHLHEILYKICEIYATKHL